MNGPQRTRRWRIGLLAVGLCGSLAAGVAAATEGPELPADKSNANAEDKLPPHKRVEDKKKSPKEENIEAEVLASLPQLPPSILPKEMNQIDLPCVLRLAGIANPEILIARQRVAEAQAVKL